MMRRILGYLAGGVVALVIGLYYAHVRPLLISWDASRTPSVFRRVKTRVSPTAPASPSPVPLRRPAMPTQFAPNGPSILICAPVSASGDADTKSVAVGLARVLEWKFANLPALYAQLPDEFNDRAARQLGVAQPLMLSREKAQKFADFVGHNFAVYGTAQRTGETFSVTLHLLNVIQEKDVGEPLQLNGTLADLLKQEGNVALEIIQRVLAAREENPPGPRPQLGGTQYKEATLDGEQQAWLTSLVVAQPDVLKLLGKTPSIARPPDAALLASLQQRAPEFPLVGVWQAQALQRKGQESEAQARGKTLATQHPHLPFVRFAYVTLLKSNAEPPPPPAPGALFSEAEMKRQEAWSQRLNQIYQENSALPEAFRQSLRGKWVASLNAAQPQEWHVNNEYPHYDVQQLNSRVPEIYFVASNRPERDVQNFEEAHRVNRPQSADELCRAARAFAQLGNHARAQQILKSILPRIPSGLINVPVQMSSTPMSREYTSTYERLFSWAQGFRRAKATAEEVLFYEEALRRERHPIGLNAAAVCYYRLGQRDRAQTYWEEIIRDWSPEKHRETGDWFRHALLGRALLRMDEGKVESAIALYATGSDGLGSISYAGLSYLREIWSPQMEVALRRIAAAAIQRFPAATPEVDEEKKSTGQ